MFENSAILEVGRDSGYDISFLEKASFPGGSLVNQSKLALFVSSHLHENRKDVKSLLKSPGLEQK